MYRSILVATDGSEHSARALKQAGLLARMSGARLILFHVAPQVHIPPYSEGYDVRQWGISEEAKEIRDAQARQLLAEARRQLGFPDLQIEERFVVGNQPYEAILDAAKLDDCDLIVMAPHGHHGMAGILLGSQTQKVLTHSRISVLVVR